MNRNEVAATALRIFALVIFIYGIRELLPAMFMYLDKVANIKGTGAFGYTGLFGVIGISVLIFIVAPLLWFLPYTIASIILPKEKFKAEEHKWSNEHFLSCGFVILGVYFLYYVISDAVYWFYITNYPIQNFFGVVTGYTTQPLNVDQHAGIVSTVVEFFLSVFLIFGASGISKLILKIRGRRDF